MRGFTLIELMVVIVIMAVVTVFAIPRYGEYSNNQKLSDAASGLQTILRQAQNNAQTGTVCKSGSATYPATKWTVTINPGSYSVSPACDFSTAPTPTPTPGVQVYLLPSGVTISGIQLVDLPNLDNSCSALSPLSVTIEYKNLSSSVTALNISGCPRGVTAPNVAVMIVLSLGSSTKTVVVEKGGGVYVKQQ